MAGGLFVLQKPPDLSRRCGMLRSIGLFCAWQAAISRSIFPTHLWPVFIWVAVALKHQLFCPLSEQIQLGLIDRQHDGPLNLFCSIGYLSRWRFPGITGCHTRNRYQGHETSSISCHNARNRTLYHRRGRFSLGSFYLPYHGVGGVKFFFRYKGFVRIFGDDPFFAGDPALVFVAHIPALSCVIGHHPRYIYRFLRCSAQ